MNFVALHSEVCSITFPLQLLFSVSQDVTDIILKVRMDKILCWYYKTRKTGFTATDLHSEHLSIEQESLITRTFYILICN